MVAMLDVLEALGFGGGGEGKNEGDVNKEREGKVFGFCNKHGEEWRRGEAIQLCWKKKILGLTNKGGEIMGRMSLQARRTTVRASSSHSSRGNMSLLIKELDLYVIGKEWKW
jgi:hypothetical protein